ncbi:MAG TPA: pyridoxamine 5'-phosphate oxidase family protein [Chloroflexia bacterium]|nr:pyridoxamine 5'-phosphate oxidase family protein [Chloroflexia bacterium]
MAGKDPVAERMLSGGEATAIPWSEVLERFLEEGSTYWLATVRPDGRPHVVPFGPALSDGAFYFTTGQGTRKGHNLAGNPNCVITFAVRGLDVAIEGTAARVTDKETLERVAEVYRTVNGWPATVQGEGFDAPFSAPTTGPAPYDVYEVTPTIAYAFGTEEGNVYRSTRYRFQK